MNRRRRFGRNALFGLDGLDGLDGLCGLYVLMGCTK